MADELVFMRRDLRERHTPSPPLEILSPSRHYHRALLYTSMDEGISTAVTVNSKFRRVSGPLAANRYRR